jgi:hypothetical protein
MTIRNPEILLSVLSAAVCNPPDSKNLAFPAQNRQFLEVLSLAVCNLRGVKKKKMLNPS